MSSVVLSGDTSGTMTVTVPAVAGSNTVTIPAGTGTVAVQGVSTNIVSGTAVASTSGTSIDFTSIPSWVKRITVMFAGVSTNGSSILILQLGSGSVATSGYLGAGGDLVGAVASNFTVGFGTETAGNTAQVRHGSIRFCNLSGNTWAADGILSLSNGAQIFYCSGSVALSGTLDRVRVTTVNGTDTFDAGSINILYE